MKFKQTLLILFPNVCLMTFVSVAIEEYMRVTFYNV